VAESERDVRPYYEDEMVTLYQGDCRVILPIIPKGSVDLLVTDPPYGQDFKSNRGHDHAPIIGDDGSLDVPAALAVAARCLRRSRHAYIFGPWDLSATPLTAQVELIWDKGVVGMGNLELPWSTSHEPVTFAVYEPSKANRDKGYGKLVARIRKGSVVRAIRANGAATTRHPTEKPVEVLRQFIESSSLLGETVLDPFVGVGSTMVAAVLEGRKAIGIEIDAEFCSIAAKRLEALRASQPTLAL
jgi:site-specific DNA-methyltransferase (adenine-specific)